MLRLVKAVRSSRWFHPLLLLLWVAVGAGLRLTRLTAKAPWVDEFSTIVFSLGHSFRTVPLDQALSVDALLQLIQPEPTAGIGDVLAHLLKQSNHPPLYFVLAHLWMRLFPTEDGLVSLWAARSLPALFGTLSIPAMYGLGYLAFRSRLVAHSCAAMMAVSPFGIFLAQEARHYTLAILFVIASVCCLIVAVQSIHYRALLPTKVALTWVVINTLGVATHYFFTLTLCAEALVLLALAWRQVKKRRGEAGGAGGARKAGGAGGVGGVGEAGGIGERESKGASNGRKRLHLISPSPHLPIPPSPHPPLPLSPPLLSPRSWWKILWVAAGTAMGSLVWLPILQSNYDSELTHWIYDGDPLKSWLEPIGRVLAWSITMLISLPMETTTLPLGIAIASGVVTVIFILWALPILRYGLKREHFQPNARLNLGVLGDFIIGALALFFGITYTLGADLTLAPRYQFVFFPVAIALLGATLATSWNTPTQEAKMEPAPVESQPSAVPRSRRVQQSEIDSTAARNSSSLLPKPYSLVPISLRGGKKAVTLIWLAGLLGALTVTWNLGYLQSIRPDFLVDVIQKVSNTPVLIATTYQHHGHTGRMMALAWEFKHLDQWDSPASHQTASPQFLLADDEPGSQTKDPTARLQETVAGLPRPLDVWLVNFHAKVDLTQQKCFAASQPLPKLDSYWYRLYRCPASEIVGNG